MLMKRIRTKLQIVIYKKVGRQSAISEGFSTQSNETI
jgi:hypothetical protein